MQDATQTTLRKNLNFSSQFENDKESKINFANDATDTDMCTQVSRLRKEVSKIKYKYLYSCLSMKFVLKCVTIRDLAIWNHAPSV